MAIGIFALLVVAVLPQLIVGIKSNDTARRSTQAKSLALAELERMRNLPFHVAPTAGNYIDVFDRYYPHRVAPTSTPVCTSNGAFVALAVASSGYVSSTGTRCSWEPASGAFFRQVRSGASDPDLKGFVVVVDTQFLTDTQPPTPVSPPTGYDTQVVGRDAPASAQIGVTVTVLPWGRKVKFPLSTYTRISRHYQTVQRISSNVDVTALELGGQSTDSVPVTLSSGLVKLNGSLTYGTNVDAVVAGATAATGTGQLAGGASSTMNAPPNSTGAALDAGDGQLDASGCDLACWGGTRLSSRVVTAADGLPNAGSPAAPLEATVKEPSAGGRALAFGAGAGASYRDSLKLTSPLVRLKEGAIGSATTSSCTVGTTGSNVRVGASGWLRSTAPSDTANPMVVDACGTARTSPTAVLPTSFAPDGLLRIRLTRASVRCLVSGDGHTASTAYDFSATVERWTPTGYVTVATVVPGATTDPLAAINLATTSVGTGEEHGVLADWIDSWSAVTVGQVRRVASAGTASLAIPGVVNVVTRPLRNTLDDTGQIVRDGNNQPVPEPLSSLSLSFGVLSCSAKDQR